MLVKCSFDVSLLFLRYSRNGSSNVSFRFRSWIIVERPPFYLVVDRIQSIFMSNNKPQRNDPPFLKKKRKKRKSKRNDSISLYCRFWLGTTKIGGFITTSLLLPKSLHNYRLLLRNLHRNFPNCLHLILR